MLCTTVHPLRTRVFNIFGTSLSEATMRPNPRFPCNQFGGQEPGDAAEIKKCAADFGATFPLFAKIEVSP